MKTLSRKDWILAGFAALDQEGMPACRPKTWRAG